MTAYLTNRTYLLLAAGALLILGILAFSLKFFFATESVETRVVSPIYGDISSSVITTGKVLPVDDFQARANFPGMIEKICVHLGDHVNIGQLLVTMKDPFLHQRIVSATTALESVEVGRQNIQQGGTQEERINFAADRARAELEQADATKSLAALKQLQQSGSVSEAEIFGATRRLQAANATLQTINERSSRRFSPKDVASWNSRVAEAKAILDAQKVTFQNANITSPIAGTAYLIPARAYDFVSAGADLLHVADLNKIEIHAYFDEPDIGKLHIGQPVSITWEGRLNQTWHGHVTRAPLAAMASGVRNVGDCTIAVDDSNGELLPNTNVTVTVTFQSHTHVLTVPREALHTDGPANFVYRAVGETLERTPVDIGLINLNSAEITRGLTSQDAVALHATDNSPLKQHLKVTTVR